METCHKALFHHILMFNVAVVGEGLDGNAATRIEQTDNLQILRIHQLDQVLHNDVDAILVKVTVITETEEIEFKALALYHQCARDVINNKVTEVGLACLGAQGGELRTIQSHEILILRMFIFKGLQHLGRIVVAVLGVLIAQQRDTFQFLFVS